MLRSCLFRGVALVALGLPLLLFLTIVTPVLAHLVRGEPFTVSLAVDRRLTPSPAPSQTATPGPVLAGPASASGVSVVGGPSLSADVVNRVLAGAGSPAQGTGQALYDLSVTYQIDDAYALATFQKESSFGRAGVARETHSLGNIICAGYPTCLGRFRSYRTWEEAYTDFYRLIAREYVASGLTTVETIIPKYAPSSENDTVLYIHDVCRLMAMFRET
jgi:hypothetical protein